MTTVVPLNEICVPLPNLEYIAGNDVVAAGAAVAVFAAVVGVDDGAAADEDDDPQCSSGSTPTISAAVAVSFVMAATITAAR